MLSFLTSLKVSFALRTFLVCFGFEQIWILYHILYYWSSLHEFLCFHVLKETIICIMTRFTFSMGGFFFFGYLFWLNINIFTLYIIDVLFNPIPTITTSMLMNILMPYSRFFSRASGTFVSLNGMHTLIQSPIPISAVASTLYLQFGSGHYFQLNSHSFIPLTNHVFIK